LKINGSAFNRKEISEIAIDPTNSNIAYVATVDVESPLSNSSTDDGVWKTIDGGVTWTNTTAAVSTNPWTSVRMDLNNPSTLYAAVGVSSGNAENSVYKTTDGGVNWTKLAGAPKGVAAGRIIVAVSKSDPSAMNSGSAVPQLQGRVCLGFGDWKEREHATRYAVQIHAF
jgi:hypothetical protein